VRGEMEERNREKRKKKLTIFSRIHTEYHALPSTNTIEKRILLHPGLERQKSANL
jgi:hypothetical protein